ncbi:unnamed protein product [Durusdinium trenchii]|uniref:Formamidopyrimidine-DNA glycosylase catalytic domain-containing protein n=1 Tax=Durusdinium trenchii TaxID=1381693 RepID=A0ABP0HUC6_9DINO
MPELPEVEFSRRLVQKSLAKKRISAVKVANDKIVCQVPAGRLKALKGRTVKQCRRWGKQLWFEMDKGPSPMFHLGMTGSFHVKGRNSLKYVRLKEDDPKTWPPKFWKVEFQMSDGTCFAMSDPRRFGRIGLSTSVWEEPCMAKMGFDPLLQMPRVEDFARQLARRSGDIKAVLLDQSFAAGVGNWVADEVLYQAAVHPQDVAKNLSPNAVKALHRTLRQVVKKACQVNADAKKFPRTWLFHYRWELEPFEGGLPADSTTWLELGPVEVKAPSLRMAKDVKSGFSPLEGAPPPTCPPCNGRVESEQTGDGRRTGDLGDLPGDSGRNEEKRQSDETIFK